MTRGIAALCLTLVALFTPSPAQDLVPSRPQHTATDPGERPSERRARWFRKGRTSPDQRPAAEWLGRAAAQRNMMRNARREEMLRIGGAAAAATVGAQPWRSLGPGPMESSDQPGSEAFGPVTGRVAAVAVHPTNPNIVYVGAATGGVWKSTNAAAADPTTVTWTNLTDAQESLTIGALAIHPKSPNIVLAGTGEAKSAIDSYYGVGLLRSEDGGASWQLITNSGGPYSFKGVGFSSIVFHPDNPNLVVASTANAAKDLGSLVGIDQYGIFYSLDAGKTWHPAAMADGSTPISRGSTFSVIYHKPSRKWFAAVRRHGFYSSTDGVNWTRLPTQPDAALTTNACPSQVLNGNACPIGRGMLATASGRNEIYAWYVDTSWGHKGVFVSSDAGATWTSMDTKVGMEACGDTNGCGAAQSFYNMALRALPNGDGTDLYAGAINIFKCSLAAGATECTNGWQNVTHVYGTGSCGAAAIVHPDQHYFAEAPSDPRILYVGNDGGIYRALRADTITGSNTASSCAFDNLNHNMGSTLQFVWFSQSASDPKILLGGTQDNGSPATLNAGGSMHWNSQFGGDGGYNFIHPSKPEWFVSYVEVNVWRCTTAPDCRGWTRWKEVATNNTLGGDATEFYTPYTLDAPADQLYVGTCRVWRLATDGNGKVALSPNFTTDTVAKCTEDHKTVRSLAVGGPRLSGVASVVWAGTTSVANNSPGRVYVSFNAADPTPVWADVTPAGIPAGAPVSSIVLDPTDATGRSAFFTVMSFNTKHVYRTTNGGTSWTDVTGNLPDAPANAFAVDPIDPSYWYVGTDVGVFVTSNGGATWTEFGTGLPNVPVTHMLPFRSGTTGLLRISTYGRGVWETALAGSATAVPEFTMTVDAPGKQVWASASATTFSGKLTAVNGYDKQVTVTCTNGAPRLPQTCGSANVLPTAGGASYSIDVADSEPGLYSFNLHAAGTDGKTQDKLVTYRVVDFELTAPAPFSVPQTGGGMGTVTVTPEGTPSGESVAFTCGSLPPGMSCQFIPATIDITGAAARTVQLQVSAAANTPAGIHTINVTGTAVNNTSIAKSVPLAITVVSDFDIQPVAAATARVGEATSTNVTLTAGTGFTSPATLACTVAPANGPTCSLSSGTVSAYPATVTLNLTNAAGPAGVYTVTVSATAEGKTKQRTTQYNVADFSVAMNAASAQAVPGGSAISIPVVVASAYNYSGAVQLGCSLPNGTPATCVVTPASVTLAAGGTANATATVSVNPGAPVADVPVTVTGMDATLPALKHPATNTARVADFTVPATQAGVSVEAGGTVTRTFAFAAVNGFSGDIAVSCVAPAGVVCTPNPASVKAGANTTISVKTTATPGAFEVTINGASGGVSRSTRLPVSATSFALAVNGSNSASVVRGASANFKFDVTSADGHQGSVTFACTGLPSGAACSFNPATINGTGQTSMTVTTRAASGSQLAILGGLSTLGLLLPGLALLGRGSRRRLFVLAAFAITLVLVLPGCGGGGGGGTNTAPSNPGTPKGAYTVNVTATSGTMQKITTVTLTVQ